MFLLFLLILFLTYAVFIKISKLKYLTNQTLFTDFTPVIQRLWPIMAVGREIVEIRFVFNVVILGAAGDPVLKVP